MRAPAGRTTALMTVVVAIAMAAALGGCGTDPVPLTHGTPVSRDPVTGPAYAVLSPGRPIPGGPRLVEGRRTTSLPRGTTTADWLPDGNVLLGDGVTARVIDPRSGRRVGKALRIDLAEPVVSPSGITVTQARRHRITYYSPALRVRATITVPPSAMRTDQLSKDPGNADLEIGRAYIARGATWVEWYVNSENDLLTDHGVLRIEGRSIRPVSRNRPVARLTPSSDGRALLVLMQNHGNEDCGGCVVSQHLEEWSTTTGKRIADYGMPPGYDKGWRVKRMDKIGDRIVVRFALSPGGQHRAMATWIRSDKGWSEVSSLRNRAVSWQNEKPLLTTYSGRRALGNGAAFTLSYGALHGGTTLIPYADSCPDHDACLTVTAPGTMLAPSGQ